MNHFLNIINCVINLQVDLKTNKVLSYLLASILIFMAGILPALIWLDPYEEYNIVPVDMNEFYNKREIIEEFLKNNISALSPKKEILGSRFNISSLDFFLYDNKVFVTYEDRARSYRALITYKINAVSVVIVDFKIIEEVEF